MNGISHACLYCPATECHHTLAGTHFLSHSEKEAWLAWVAGYIRMWFAHPKTVTHNWARRQLISLMHQRRYRVALQLNSREKSDILSIVVLEKPSL